MNYKNYAHHHKQKAKKKRTVPQPFAFDERDRKRKNKKTIRQRKLEKMIEEDRKKKEEPYKVKFKANKVPKHVK